MFDAALTVTLESGESFTARPNAGTILAMEQYYGSKIESGLAAIQTMRLEYLCWLAWECRRKSGETVPPFEKFWPQVENIEVEDNSTTPLAVEEPPTP